MRNAIICIFVIAVSVATCADGRVYYLTEDLDGGGARNNDAFYPIVEQQPASHDLDLAFSAGDSSLENENAIPSTRKVYTLVAPEKSDRPIAYNYRLTEPAARRATSFDDIVLVPQGGRKLMKLNGNNKGEVILELRVIANHDSA